MGNCNTKPKPRRIFMFGAKESGKTTILYRLKLQQHHFTTQPTLGCNVETLVVGQEEFTIFDVSGAILEKSFCSKLLEDADAIIFVVDSSRQVPLPSNSPNSKPSKSPLSSSSLQFSPFSSLKQARPDDGKEVDERDDATHSKFRASPAITRSIKGHTYEFSNQEDVITETEMEDEHQASQELFSWVLQQPKFSSKPVLIYANKQDLPNSRSSREIRGTLKNKLEQCPQSFVQACSAKTGAGLLEGLEWLTRALQAPRPKQGSIKKSRRSVFEFDDDQDESEATKALDDQQDQEAEMPTLVNLWLRAPSI